VNVEVPMAPASPSARLAIVPSAFQARSDKTATFVPTEVRRMSWSRRPAASYVESIRSRNVAGLRQAGGRVVLPDLRRELGHGRRNRRDLPDDQPCGTRLTRAR
jgi:hypothetical protein